MSGAMRVRGTNRADGRSRRWLWGIVLCWLGAASAAAQERLELVWPTPSRAWAEGKPATEWLQHAGSGDPQSGAFGGVRSGGSQFHEGIDIRPVGRDRRGAPTDSVFAVLPGVVRHVAGAPSGGYGRYVVLEHPGVTPAVYSLYAHLASIAPGLRPGQTVAAGATLGLMGHSAGGYRIPPDRAHLHFEIGVMVTRDFQSWYERKKFGSRNEQGIWNGMNLLGLDPQALFEDWRARRITTLQDVFARQETVVRLRIATARTPDFVTRYPSLLTKPLPLGPVSGWEIRFNWTGLPFAWTPLTGLETIGLAAGVPRIMEVNAEVERRQRSKSLATQRGGEWTVGRDLEPVLQLLFGLR